MTSASAGDTLTVASSSCEARMGCLEVLLERQEIYLVVGGELNISLSTTTACSLNRSLGPRLSCDETHREIDRLHVLGDVTHRDEVDAGLGDGANIVEAHAARGLERGAAGGEADCGAKLVE